MAKRKTVLREHASSLNTSFKEALLYRQEDEIALLTSEIQDLKKQIAALKVLAANDSLVKLWDNKYDDRWDSVKL